MQGAMASLTVSRGEIDVVNTQAVRLCDADALAALLTDEGGPATAAAAFSHKHSLLRRSLFLPSPLKSATT